MCVEDWAYMSFGQRSERLRRMDRVAMELLLHSMGPTLTTLTMDMPIIRDFTNELDPRELHFYYAPACSEYSLQFLLSWKIFTVPSWHGCIL